MSRVFELRDMSLIPRHVVRFVDEYSCVARDQVTSSLTVINKLAKFHRICIAMSDDEDCVAATVVAVCVCV